MPIVAKRFASLIAVIVALLIVAPGVEAQVFDATRLKGQVVDASDLTEPIDLGGLWRIQTNDNPAYARPDYDDSKWRQVDVGKDSRTYMGGEEPEVLWYRLHVKISPGEKGLGLEVYSVGPAYELYLNGKLLRRAGSVKPYVPWTYQARNIVPVPAAEIESGHIVLALRMHVTQGEWRSKFNPPGLFSGNLYLGSRTAMQDAVWVSLIGANAQVLMVFMLGLGVGLVALALFLAQRQRIEYLWLFLCGFFQFCAEVLHLVSEAKDIPNNWVQSVPWALVTCGASLSFVALYFAFLRVRMWTWFRIWLGIALACEAFYRIDPARFQGFHPIYLVSYFSITVIINVLLPVLVVIETRRGNRESGVLLIPLLLMCLESYPSAVFFLLNSMPLSTEAIVNLSHRYEIAQWRQVGPFSVSITALILAMSWCAWAFILVWRSNRTSTEQARLENELEAARQVQEVILPEPAGSFPGFEVESAYRPAQQVGGDFFQILPVGDDGLLLVVGDVAGKGISAAMLVAVLVGAVRTITNFTDDPAAILAELNTRLIGRTQGGFSTCLAARIDSSGVVSLANAGHLPPFLDGSEVEMTGSLPLGIVAGQQYENQVFPIGSGSRIVFYSDGLIEAQDGKGQLLGFERSRELSLLSAEQIAAKAVDFGQSDDITVVAIKRSPAPVEQASGTPAAVGLFSL